MVLQKSLKEGFGLTATEALWKFKPVIGGACGGITLQVHDYQTGFLVHSPAGAAYRIRYLLHTSISAGAWGGPGTTSCVSISYSRETSATILPCSFVSITLNQA